MSRRIVHLRIWTNNPRDVKTACGLFTRTYRKPRKFDWSDSTLDVTCEECKLAWEKVNERAS